ncbi:MAG: hypothetical protein JNM63_10345, partial [Spirochaetia bacterium]|nr:hypothetical protein [Spirochaetia bacterium]
MKFLESPYYTVLENDIKEIKNGIDFMPEHFETTRNFIHCIDNSLGDFKYGDDKWS